MELFRLFGSIFVDNSGANESIDETEQKAEKSSGTFEKMGGAAKAVGGFLGGALVAGAAAAAAGIGALFVAGENMQQSLNKLQQQTGATDKEMKGMEESLKNIYKNNYGESFEDIASAMAITETNTQLAGKELESLTQNALMLRDTFEFEVNESTRAAETMMKQFGITGEQAMTLIAQGAQQGANRNDDLLDSLMEYSPQFAAIGLDAEYFMDILISGSQNGVWSIDKLGDAVKEMNIKMKDGNEETIEALKALGLNAKEMTSGFAQGGEAGHAAFGKIMSALSQAEDPIKKNQIGVAIMGTMFEDLEAKAIDSLANVDFYSDMTGDTLAKINEIKYDSFGEALQGIGRNLMMGVFDPFQEKVMPIVNEFAQWISAQMPVVEEITNKTFTAIFNAADVVWQFFRVNILPIFLEWYGNINEFFPIIRAVAEAVFGALLAVAKSLWDFFKVNLLPIFVSLFEWVQGHMPTIRATMEAVFGKIKEVASMVWTFFQDNLLPIFTRFFSWVQGHMPTIKSIIEGAFTVIKNVIEIVWDIFENFLLPVLKALWDWISPNIPKIQTIVEKTFDAIFWAVDKVVDVFEAVTEAIKKAIDWLTFWDDKEPKDKNLNVNTNYTSSGDTPRNATGDGYFEGGLTLVGERGPELVSLPRGSKISAANETRNKLGNNQGMVNNITINSSRNSARDIERTLRRLAFEFNLGG